MKTTGIDYSMGLSNVDAETEIHYGVIHHGEVLQAWADSGTEDYDNICCPYCGMELEDGFDSDRCESCGNDLNCEDFGEYSPEGFYLEDEEYSCYQYADDCDIFITKSPYFTYCAFCSPCAPGAGYLTDARSWENGIRSYCFGHDWFEGGIAPYRVYSVKTEELVLPEAIEEILA